MAEAILGVVCMNLNSLIQDEFGFLWGVDDEMRKLSSTLSTIRAVLADAEEKQLKDREIQDWLSKLKDAAYDVDDILDECATEASSSRILSRFRLANVLFRHKIGKRMKKIRERLDEIAGERMKFHLQEGVVGRRDEARDRRETGSILTQSQVYGREEDKERIVEFLVKHAINCEDVSIYPIVGMGGLGKATLAQLVFNDETVNGHFQSRIWVCVSEDFNVKRVIKAIIRCAGGDADCEAFELEPLQRRLQELLNGRRYLLVLDDIWNEDQEKWDRLKHVLACGSKGASIIITTRVEKVASIMGTLPSHHLSSLSEDDCWSLFKQRAFGKESEEHPNLVAIGKEIVRKCRGIPLAAKALGGLMRFKRAENEWLSIQESEIWNLPQHENSIMLTLRLSYYNLPMELRRCFSYCALFPKDSDMEKETVIDLWMANGFVSSNGKLEEEDIGNEIWNELYWRSFFQDVKEDDFGNIIGFKMHDLMHDLAQSVMVDECCIVDVERSTNISKRTRHVSLVTNSQQVVTIPEALYKVESLRTLLPQPMQSWRFSVSLLSSKFGLLRVFVASGSKITELSSSVGKLKHLRYLDLSWTQIRMLPESICDLWNLQTLKVEWCRDLQRLPKQMRRLRNLRNLYMNGCFSVSQMPPKIGQLTCLKMLSFFIVGEKRGFRLCELQGLNLRGEIDLEHLERVKDPKDAKEANLVCKQNLHKLYLSWGSNSKSELVDNVEQVLEALEPHPNLEWLCIEGYKGIRFPLWLRNPVLQNLVRIELSNCRNCVELPPFGKIPVLRTLRMDGMKCVEYIDNESHGGAVRGFPSLEKLHLRDLPSLKRLSVEEGGELFPCLTCLKIDSCPKLSLPCLSSLKELEVRGCNEVLLSSISNLHSLTSLEVYGNNNETTSFPDGFLQNLTSLQTLNIQSFTKLEVLPTDLVSLTALKSLRIAGCNELECFPGQGLGGLTSLQCLEIYNCKRLKFFSKELQNLSALERFVASGCPELVASPEALLQHVPALQSLHISDCPDLSSLPDWLGNLTSLQSLEIWRCPNLASLPVSIQSLTILQTLHIRYCPQLEGRCEKETGEDWYKISHIPKVILS